MMKRLIGTILLASCGGAPQPETAGTTAEVAQTIDTAVFVEHGGAVFQVSGCAGCHGSLDGVQPSLEDVPALTAFVARFGLETDEDRDTAIGWIASGAVHDPAIDTAAAELGLEQFVLAERLYRELILGDGHATVLAALDLVDPMPVWRESLSPADVDALLAYLIDTVR